MNKHTATKNGKTFKRTSLNRVYTHMVTGDWPGMQNDGGQMTHPEFRYDAKHDIVLVRCEITGFWHTAQDPEGAAYCEGCSESVTVPASAQRPQTALPPSVPVVSVLEEERKDAQKPKTLPCGHISHEDGGPADYSARCRR